MLHAARLTIQWIKLGNQCLLQNKHLSNLEPDFDLLGMYAAKLHDVHCTS